MDRPVTQLVLLPGMDGTGELFHELFEGLPDSVGILVVRYPENERSSYPDLMDLVRSSVPAERPFLLLAESYSTPLAIRFAATHPSNLKGLILCAGFASSPLRGWRKGFCSFFAPVLFRLPMTGFVVRYFLVGWGAPASLVCAVRGVISSVDAKVLVARLREVLACDVRVELSRVAVPMLYIRALRDRLVAASCCAEMQRILPHLVVEEMDGPHLILQREPMRAAAVVAKFIQQIK